MENLKRILVFFCPPVQKNPKEGKVWKIAPEAIKAMSAEELAKFQLDPFLDAVQGAITEEMKIRWVGYCPPPHYVF